MVGKLDLPPPQRQRRYLYKPGVEQTRPCEAAQPLATNKHDPKRCKRVPILPPYHRSNSISESLACTNRLSRHRSISLPAFFLSANGATYIRGGATRAPTALPT